ncbi:MAG TPA: hypothetical protein VF608_06750, partial [Thermoanaerobaculia bacterium]
LNLYAMYLRTGDRAKAEALYERLLVNARDEQTRFAARNVRLIAETNRANELARKGDLDAAAVIIRSIANGNPDLEREATRLEETAAINRHIRMYNDAILYSNAGKPKDALKVLDALLAVATDPAVVRDAKKLQAELKK